MIVWDADGALERDAQIVVDDNGVTFQLALQRLVVGRIPHVEVYVKLLLV